MAWALDQQIVTEATARHVLLCLANYADDKGRGAFPSVDTLTRDTGLSERTVRYKLDALEDIQAIRRGNQALAAVYVADPRRRPVVYDVCMSRGAPDAPQDGVRCNSRAQGVQLKPARGAPAAPNPSLNLQVTGERGANASSLPEDLLALGVDPVQWQLFVDHHTSIGRWSGARLWNALGQLRAVIKQGHRPNDVLQRAVARSHADLVEAANDLARDARKDQPGNQTHGTAHRASAGDQVRAAAARGSGQSGVIDGTGRRVR